MIAAREFSTGAECIAHAAAVRKRIMSAKPKRFIPAVIEAPRPFKTNLMNEWERDSKQFDYHVILYNMAMKILHFRTSGQGRTSAEWLQSHYRPANKIIAEVLREYPEYTLADIRSPRRMRPLVKARNACVIAVRRERPDLSFPQIGKIFNRDHTSILAICGNLSNKKGASVS